MPRSDNNALRVFISAIPTDYRLYTLMHDCQYRMGVATENVGYNQPPHTSYYIGSIALASDSERSFNYLDPTAGYATINMVDPDKNIIIDIDGMRVTLQNGVEMVGEIYVVFYDEYNKMLSVEHADAQEKLIYMQSAEDAVSAKVIMWDSLSSLKPVCGSKVVDLRQ